MKNFDESGIPILTDRAKESFLTFVELCTFETLNIGIRNLIFNYLKSEDVLGVWFFSFVEQACLFYDFLDELGEEYPGY